MSVIVMTDRIRSLRAVVFAALCVALAATAHVAMAGSGVSAPVLTGAFAVTLGLSWLLAGRRRGLGVISAWMVAAQTALHLTFEQAGALAAGSGLGRLGTTDWASLLLCNPERAPAGISPADLARMAGIDPDVPPAGSLRAAAGGHHLGTHGGPVSADAADHGMSGMNGMSGMAGMSGGPGGSGGATLSGGTGLSGGSGMSGGTGMSGHDMAAHGMSAGMIAAHLLAAFACALLLWRGEAALARLFELLAALGAVLAGALLAPLLALWCRPRGYRPPASPRPAAHRVRPPRLLLLSHAVVRRGPPCAAPVR
ncbi:hypothetical protein ACFVHB_03315 [Kitasatospora sp. NPDC127111]|uniref:hypothetical protein n=1 Tax=Kitasatospora sp. NPDC127111 TaxID=3345363 RepID=UPI00363C9A6B